MSDELHSLLAQSIEMLTPLILALLSWGVGEGIRYLRSKTKREWVGELLTRVEGAMLTTVRAVEQRIVADLRAAREDGKITPEEAASIRRAALATAKAQLGEQGMAMVKKYAGEKNVDAWLLEQLEAKVHELKEWSIPRLSRLALGEDGAPSAAISGDKTPIEP